MKQKMKPPARTPSKHNHPTALSFFRCLIPESPLQDLRLVEPWLQPPLVVNHGEGDVVGFAHRFCVVGFILNGKKVSFEG